MIYTLYITFILSTVTLVNKQHLSWFKLYQYFNIHTHVLHALMYYKVITVFGYLSIKKWTQVTLIYHHLFCHVNACIVDLHVASNNKLLVWCLRIILHVNSLKNDEFLDLPWTEDETINFCQRGGVLPSEHKCIYSFNKPAGQNHKLNCPIIVHQFLQIAGCEIRPSQSIFHFMLCT